MLLKADEAARILAVKTPRVYELARIGAIPSVRLGEKQVRFSEVALREFIEKGGERVGTDNERDDQRAA